jgi:hypothetical protein
MEKRDFTPFREDTELEGSRGLKVNAIQIRAQFANRLGEQKVVETFNGRPIVLDEPARVMVMEFAPGGETGERSARFPILFAVTSGSGWVRIGGATAERVPIAQNEAVLWPTGQLFKAWAGDAGMTAIGVEYLSTIS